MAKMKVLIVGASGFIGRHLLVELCSAGHEALGTASKHGVYGLHKFDLLKDRVENAIPNDFFIGREPKLAVIAAAVTKMDDCLIHPEKSRTLNVLNTKKLVRYLQSHGCRVVYLSTGHVFDGSVGNRNEEDSTSPINEYARLKLEMEEFLRIECPESFIARLDKVVGDNPLPGHLLAEWWDLANKKSPILCVEGMEFSPTCVRDVARGLRFAMELGLSGIYHLAGPDKISRTELARHFCRIGHFDVEVAEKPLPFFGFLDGRAVKSSLNSQKFRQATGFAFANSRKILEAFFLNAKSY
jgi:dTDP-4-dehydrorhamnose reductase